MTIMYKKKGGHKPPINQTINEKKEKRKKTKSYVQTDIGKFLRSCRSIHSNSVCILLFRI